MYGRKATGPNGNSIFIPAAGYRSGINLKDDGVVCSYWTSSRNTSGPYYAPYGFDLETGNYYSGGDHRSDGRTVRAVVRK